MIVTDEFLAEVLETASKRTGDSLKNAERLVLTYFPRYRGNYLTKSEAAQYLRVCERSIDKARNNGLRWTKLGKQVLFKIEDLQAYAEAHTYDGGPDSVPCLSSK